MSRKQTQIDIEARRVATVKAVTDVFLRYGYARTTMAELAAAAGLSRPSLYEIFPSKDELFSAVIQAMSEETIEKFRKELPRLRTLRSKLHRFCGDWATHGIRLAERHPDAKDLFDFSFPAVHAMYEDFVRFLAGLITSKQTTVSAPVEGVLRNLVYSLRGLKEAAQDTAHMEQLVRLQVDVFLTALPSA